MELRPLAIKDKLLFDKFFKLRLHELSVYAFENVYIWKGLFEIYWAIIDQCLCVFFKDKLGCFLYFPPQSRRVSPEAISAAFGIMDKYNRQSSISRIENIEEEESEFYRKLGYVCREKFPDYLCQRNDLVDLSGDRFKSKRSCINYFCKHSRFEYSVFTSRYKDECLALYDDWMQKRKEKYKDTVYQGMLSDSRNCLEVLLKDFKQLDFSSGLVKIDKKIKAFTFGLPLSSETFCVLYEISDLKIKGLSQYIFHRFCAEQKNYRYINIMDDSGLENLKKVKLSYHPYRLSPSFIATRKE